MNYTESLGYLENLGTFGIQLGMERIEGLLKELGNPEQSFKTIHVTGTNGKGSVTSMISNILLAAGLKTGKFTSPHLVKWNERIELDGKEISDEVFADVITTVKAAADNIVRKGVCQQPTQFEILTAAAFLYYQLEAVDYAVIEVGMGGLWDSTNVITPVVSVITNVDMDHSDRLGDSLERVAMQKAGIIKEGVSVVSAAEGNEALGPIVSFAMFRNAPVYLYGKAFWGTELESSMAGQRFILHAGDNYASAYELSLPGEHQIKNTCLAVVAAKIVSKQDERITEEALHRGVALTKWAGRLERISQKPDVILDGAHNPGGAAALRQALDKFYPQRRICFVFGMMKDKDVGGVVKTLIKDGDCVYTVRADESERAAQPSELAQLVGTQAVPADDLISAYEQALLTAGNDGVVVVCGSLYLVGEFKKLLLRASMN